MNKNRLATAIVVNFNGQAHLKDCLDSLCAQTYRPLEIILVDNASTDGSREWAVREYGAKIKLIALNKNLGFDAGVNRGVAEAQGEFILLLNSDAVATPEWAAALIAAVHNRPTVGMAASKILFARRPGLIDKVGHLIYWDGQNRGQGTGAKDVGQFDRREPALWPDGCAALYRRSLLNELGGFDEDFFLYGDDAELGLRARMAGWECLYEPRAVVYHLHSASLGAYTPRKIFFVERNRLFLAAKLFPGPLLLLNPLFFSLRLTCSIVAMLTRRGATGAFIHAHGRPALLGALVAAQAAALFGLPRILAKRRTFAKTRNLNDREVFQLLWRYRIGLYELCLQD